MWPMLLDITKDESVRMLRELELTAYANVVSTFRAQGNLTPEKKKILRELQDYFSISLERHQAEVRRATNDEKLTTIATYISGLSNSSEWVEEGKRLIPLLPRLVPQTAFYGIANASASCQQQKNEAMPPPSATQNKRRLAAKEVVESKKSREENQNIIVTRKNTPSTPKAKQMLPVSGQVVRSRVPLTFPSKQGAGQSTAPRVILVTSNSGSSNLIHVSSNISSTSSTYSRPDARTVKATVKAVEANQNPKAGTPRVMSQKLIVVPNCGKPGYTIPVPGNLRGLQLGTSSGVVLPSSSMGSPALTIHSYGKNMQSKPNVIIVPSKSTNSTQIGSGRPIVVNASSRGNSQPRVVTIRSPPDTKNRVIIEGPNEDPDRSNQKPKNTLQAGNVIEIQATGDAIQNLVRKGTLSQDLMELVQKAVSMAGTTKSTHQPPNTVLNEASTSNPQVEGINNSDRNVLQS